MKMSKFVLPVMLSSLFFCGSAFAEMYVSGSLGTVITHDSDVASPGLASSGNSDVKMTYDTGFIGAVAVGNSFTNSLRAEGEFAYRQAELDQTKFNNSVLGPVTQDGNGDITSMTLMANIYYDFMKERIVSPFVGCGFGFNRVEADPNGDSEDDIALAYQFAAGASFKVSEKVNLDLTYKYLTGSDLEFSGNTDFSYASSNVTAGVRVKF